MLKKFQLFFYLSIGGFLLAAAAVAVIPLLQVGVKGLDAKGYAVGALFWVGILCGIVFLVLTGKQRKQIETVDGYLGRFDDWRDSAQWPTSKRQSEVIRKTISAQEDPLNKEGLVGAFCRTYFPSDAIWLIRKASKSSVTDLLKVLSLKMRTSVSLRRWGFCKC